MAQNLPIFKLFVFFVLHFFTKSAVENENVLWDGQLLYGIVFEGLETRYAARG